MFRAMAISLCVLIDSLQSLDLAPSLIQFSTTFHTIIIPVMTHNLSNPKSLIFQFQFHNKGIQSCKPYHLGLTTPPS